MSDHRAIIRWRQPSPDFLKGRYSRAHTWTFDGGLTVAGSPAPGNAPTAFINPAAVDPEEAFVAALSSCHMLTFLFVAYKEGFAIESYEDEAVGVMTKNEKGIPWVSTVTLHPKIVYAANRLPSPAEQEHLHHLAHEECIIANSVKTEIQIVPV